MSRRPKRELPTFVQIGARVQHICKCDCPTPGEYIVTRIGAARKMAWAEHSSGGGQTVLFATSFREWGDRYVLMRRAPEGGAE